MEGEAQAVPDPPSVTEIPMVSILTAANLASPGE